MKLTSIIFEGFRENPSIINGKKYSVDWIGTADTLLDFTRALDRIPDTIESIKVPIDTTYFNPNQKEIFPEGDWKKKVRTIIFQVVGEHEKKGNKLEGIRISSYYGVGVKGADDHPIYVSVDTKQSREFGDAMSRGDYGPLD
jgi:hypothetical protein|tara:strand:+ start:757 stop:1182 length:426 start_codon:yes stop_codon:yes gene_type:complete